MLLAACAALAGCASSDPLENGWTEVVVVAADGEAVVVVPGQPPAATPYRGFVPTEVELLQIGAERDGVEPVERRLRLLAPQHAELVFRFAADGWWVRQELALDRATVFDCGEVFADPDLVSAASGAFDLDPARFAELREVALLLTHELAGREVVVAGHGDAVAGDRDPGQLAAARARVVADFLVAHGVERRRITVLALGDRYPLVAGNNAATARRNCRAEIVVAW